MRALTVRQPHAHRIAAGLKTIELRGWRTSYRGEILICAAKGTDPGATDDMPRGVAVCVVELLDVRPASIADRAAACVTRKIGAGDFAWLIRLVRVVDPYPVRGRLGLFELDEDNACRTCGNWYADGGDGWDGECPSCADKTESRREP